MQKVEQLEEQLVVVKLVKIANLILLHMDLNVVTLHGKNLVLHVQILKELIIGIAQGVNVLVIY